ncbi:MAG: site-2 protease family protein [Sphingomonas sp.]|uniref:site-2 protease family protein n=1 Tax=Sphingomonas sp. TaxID=28214 RepID=UPI00121B5398|nr:site-2 protease family protein [Sphingomonas sp.]THD36234.1 MAG: site-2 protease family protein [Sphingomonas sp.]
MSPDNTIYQIAVWLIPLVIAIVFHEVAHGYVARLLGDHTAERLGRLTLNPIRHVDPVGTLAVPMVLALAHAPIFGWAKPVPVVAARMRHPRRDMALVALAGPGTNLVLATITVLVAAVSGLNLLAPVSIGFVGDNLSNFLLINVFLAIFNLMPIPPFDGGHVVEAALPRPLAAQYARLHRYAFPVMLFLLVILPMVAPRANVVAQVVGPIADTIVRGLLMFATALT